jgi:hypothetical protein
MRKLDANFTAAILAIGLVLAINLIIFGVVWNTISNGASVLSENATKVLMVCFGGIIALLGSSLGFMFGQRYEIPEEPEPYPYRDAWERPIPPPSPGPPPPKDEADTQIRRPDAS